MFTTSKTFCCLSLSVLMCSLITSSVRNGVCLEDESLWITLLQLISLLISTQLSTLACSSYWYSSSYVSSFSCCPNGFILVSNSEIYLSNALSTIVANRSTQARFWLTKAAVQRCSENKQQTTGKHPRRSVI